LSGTDRPMPDRALVLVELLGRQIGRLPAPDAVEAGEGMQVPDWMALESFGKTGLGRWPFLPQLGSKVPQRLQPDPEHGPGKDGDGDAELGHLGLCEAGRDPRL